MSTVIINAGKPTVAIVYVGPKSNLDPGIVLLLLAGGVSQSQTIAGNLTLAIVAMVGLVSQIQSLVGGLTVIVSMAPVISFLLLSSGGLTVLPGAISQPQTLAVANGVGGSVGGSVGYIHTQTTLSNAWSINHHLGRKPSITVINDDTTIEGTVTHNSYDVAVVTFASSINGTAYCI